MVRERASRALSMPVALRVEAGVEDEGESSWERSRPRVFFWAVLALAFLGVERWVASSAARRACVSAFLRARSSFFWAASSLLFGGRELAVELGRKGEGEKLFGVGFGTLAPFKVFDGGLFGIFSDGFFVCCFGFLGLERAC